MESKSVHGWRKRALPPPPLDACAAHVGRVGEKCNRRNRCPPNGQTVHPQDASTRQRTGGAPLAATTAAGTRWSVCKRRDAVRLALHEPARPAGAAFGVLSGATVSWAAPTHACNTTSHLDRDAIPLGLRYMWQNLGAGAAAGTSSPFAEFLLDKCGAWLHCSCKPRPEADKHGVLSGTAA